MNVISTFRGMRARVAGRKRQSGLRLWQVWPLWLICGVFVVLGVATLMTVIREGRSHTDDISEIKLSAGQDLRIVLDNLGVGRLYLFSYAIEHSQRIRFVVQRTGDGAVHSMLASCQACYPSDQPHFTLKGQVMCGACNHPMHTPDEQGLTSVQKQCALVSIPHSIRDGQVVVPANDVLRQVRAMEAQ